MLRIFRSFIAGVFYAVNGAFIILYYVKPDLIVHQLYTIPVTLMTCFILLGLLTSDFLTPSLSDISRNILHMSDRISGMTLLALGNGIPEITSAYQSMKVGSTSLAIGELVGGIFFLTTVVIGLMGLIRTIYITNLGKEFNYINILTYDRSHYIQDVSALCGMLVVSSLALWDGELRLWECIVLMLCYVIHVICLIYQIKKEKYEVNADSELNNVVNNDICDIISIHEPTVDNIEPYIDDEENQTLQQTISRFNGKELIRRDKIRCQIREYLKHNYRGRVRMTLRDCIDIWENDEIFNQDKEYDNSNFSVEDIVPILNKKRTNSLQENISNYGSQNEVPINRNLMVPGKSKDQSNTQLGLRKSMSLDFLPGLADITPEDDVAIQIDGERTANTSSMRLSREYSSSTLFSQNQNHVYVRGYRLYHYLTNPKSYTMPHFEFFLLLVTTPISIVIHTLFPTPNDTHTRVEESIAIMHMIQILVSPITIYLLILHHLPNFLFIISWASVSLIYYIWCKYNESRSMIITRNLLSITGFLVSIFAISFVVNIIVTILRNWTTRFHISESILGITVFAWGNSVGDLVSNLTFVKSGLVETALGACFGSPLLYFLFGVGFDGFSLMVLGYLHMGNHERYNNWKINFTIDSQLKLSIVGILIAMSIFFIGIPLNKWKIDRCITVLLLLDYLIITSINLYLEVVI